LNTEAINGLQELCEQGTRAGRFTEEQTAQLWKYIFQLDSEGYETRIDSLELGATIAQITLRIYNRTDGTVITDKQYNRRTNHVHPGSRSIHH
jgi:hypothetical protein